MSSTTKRLRILMSADTVGGVWTYALDLARALRPYAQVHLTAMGRTCSADQRRAARDAGCRLYESEYKLEWMESPWEDLDAAAAWLLALDRRVRPDVIHLNHYAHGNLPWSAPVVMVAHSDVYSWWQAVHRTPPPGEWERYRQTVQQGLEAADTVIAPTEAMLTALVRQYGELPTTRVIANARGGGFPLAPKQPIILAAGRLWDEAKNISALSRIAGGLHWPVYVAGEADSEAVSNVHALGFLPPAALQQWMACASIYALPAYYEPFGLSALEAAHCGCALVLGDIPSLREVWGEAAVFVAPGDDAALFHALTQLMNDAPFRHQMAEKARLHAQRYHPEKMRQHYLAEYEQMMTVSPGALRKGTKVSA